MTKFTIDEHSSVDFSKIKEGELFLYDGRLYQRVAMSSIAINKNAYCLNSRKSANFINTIVQRVTEIIVKTN